MKKIIALSLVLLSIHIAYAKKVKFSVDMRYQEVSLLGVHVAGDFQDEAGFPSDWESGTTEMLNEPGTTIYSVVVDIPADRKYEYRYINGDQTYESEFVPEYSRVGYDFIDNRWFFVADTQADTVALPAVLFGGNAPYGKKMLRVLVDMAKQNAISANGVHIAGNFQQWNTADAQLYSFIDKVYEIMVFADSTTTLEYKFYNGSTTADAELVPAECATNNNRMFVLTTDTILSTVCFASCTDCANTGIFTTQYNKINYKVFPNPFKQSLTIEFTSNANRSISILDVQGKQVFDLQNFNQSILHLENQQMASGIYLLKIIEAEGLSTSKLIVE